MQACKSILCVWTFRLARVWRLIFFLGLGGMGFCGPAMAGANEARLQVSATVMKHASLKILAQPASVVVTAADIAQGYLDVPGRAQVAVQNNSLEGYLLMFESQGEFLRQIIVKGLGSDVQLDVGAGGSVTRHAAGRGMSKEVLELGFRFVLSAAARQGVYAWPMRLSVTPL